VLLSKSVLDFCLPDGKPKAEFTLRARPAD
jgi:hypothetical protein